MFFIIFVLFYFKTKSQKKNFTFSMRFDLSSFLRLYINRFQSMRSYVCETIRLFYFQRLTRDVACAQCVALYVQQQKRKITDSLLTVQVDFQTYIFTVPVLAIRRLHRPFQSEPVILLSEFYFFSLNRQSTILKYNQAKFELHCESF